jgi:plastocyanin
MIHHFVYFAPGRVGDDVGGCWRGLGFITGRGEEHPDGRFGAYLPAERRDRYGIPNRTPSGEAPAWQLLAMVMNHVKRPKTVWVRTKLWYTEDEREPVSPVVVGDCSLAGNGMAYDVPGGGPKGSSFTRRSSWTVPQGFKGRILGGASHQHGGAKHQLLSNRTCGRDLFKAPAYYGAPDHIYNTIRPILHEPGPIANGTFGTMTGIPISGGEVIENVAVHDNANLHVAAMGFWALQVVRDDTVAPCGATPPDVVELTRPRRFDPTPNHGLVVPQLARPPRGARLFTGSPLLIGDEWFRPGRVSARIGQTLTWKFAGLEPHTVTVANGPRGFSSTYSGRTGGEYRFTPTVKGTYRLTCLIHPTTMAQTVVVRGRG